MTTFFFLLLVVGVSSVNLVIGFLAASLFGFGPWTNRVLGWFSPEISGRPRA